MRHFPIFLDLTGRRVLVIGDGPVAARKAEPLQQAGADVMIRARFDPTDLFGCALAIGADAPDADVVALSQAAQAAGIPVNVVDRPALCSYITPATIDRDPITIAVSSSGADSGSCSTTASSRSPEFFPFCADTGKGSPAPSR